MAPLGGKNKSLFTLTPRIAPVSLFLNRKPQAPENCDINVDILRFPSFQCYFFQSRPGLFDSGILVQIWLLRRSIGVSKIIFGTRRAAWDVSAELWLRVRVTIEKAFLPLIRVRVAHHHIPPFLEVCKMSWYENEKSFKYDFIRYYSNCMSHTV